MSEMIKRYSLTDLADPKTYRLNDKLATIARSIVDGEFHIHAKGQMSMGEFKRRILNGEYAALVKVKWDLYVSGIEAEQKHLTECSREAKTFIPPADYALEVSGNQVLIKGAYCEDLAKRLKRIGGYWDGARYDNRRCFVIPLDKTKSLNRIFSNWAKGREGRDAKAGQKKADKTISEIKRWLGYVEESAKQGRVYEKGVSVLCQDLGIDKYPDQNQRLTAALDLAARIKKEKAEQPSYGRSWAADNPAVCGKCGLAVGVGDQVHYRYQRGGKYLEHVDCEAAKAQAERKQTEAPYKLSGGSGYGCQGWDPGQVVRASDFDRKKNGHPEFLFVVESNRRYIRDDGMSFGVGDESGYIYWARCRETTSEEAAPLKAQIAEAERKRQAVLELQTIKKRIQETGEYPDGQNNPEGDRLFDTQNIYGGGDWFVVGPRWIWYVRNNGADGDNWSANNVRTGGAGAIGRRVAYSRELAEDLNRLRAVLDDAIGKDAQEGPSAQL